MAKKKNMETGESVSAKGSKPTPGASNKVGSRSGRQIGKATEREVASRNRKNPGQTLREARKNSSYLPTPESTKSKKPQVGNRDSSRVKAAAARGGAKSESKAVGGFTKPGKLARPTKENAVAAKKTIQGFKGGAASQDEMNAARSARVYQGTNKDAKLGGKAYGYTGTKNEETAKLDDYIKLMAKGGIGDDSYGAPAKKSASKPQSIVPESNKKASNQFGGGKSTAPASSGKASSGGTSKGSSQSSKPATKTSAASNYAPSRNSKSKPQKPSPKTNRTSSVNNQSSKSNSSSQKKANNTKPTNNTVGVKSQQNPLLPMEKSIDIVRGLGKSNNTGRGNPWAAQGGMGPQDRASVRSVNAEIGAPRMHPMKWKEAYAENAYAGANMLKGVPQIPSRGPLPNLKAVPTTAPLKPTGPKTPYAGSPKQPSVGYVKGTKYSPTGQKPTHLSTQMAAPKQTQASKAASDKLGITQKPKAKKK